MRHFYFSDPLPTEATERGGRWQEEGQRGAPGDPGGGGGGCGGLFRKTEQEGLIQKQKKAKVSYLFEFVFVSLSQTPARATKKYKSNCTTIFLRKLFFENSSLSLPSPLCGHDCGRWIIVFSPSI